MALSRQEEVYYLNKNGGNNSGQTMTGWQKINNKWYYFEGDGRMAVNAWADGCYLNADGVMANLQRMRELQAEWKNIGAVAEAERRQTIAERKLAERTKANDASQDQATEGPDSKVSVKAAKDQD